MRGPFFWLPLKCLAQHFQKPQLEKPQPLDRWTGLGAAVGQHQRQQFPAAQLLHDAPLPGSKTASPVKGGAWSRASARGWEGGEGRPRKPVVWMKPLFLVGSRVRFHAKADGLLGCGKRFFQLGLLQSWLVRAEGAKANRKEPGRKPTANRKRGAQNNKQLPNQLLPPLAPVKKSTIHPSPS